MEACVPVLVRGSANEVLDRDSRRAARRLGSAPTAAKPGRDSLSIIADYVIADCVRGPTGSSPLWKWITTALGWSSTPALLIQL